jgi:hypothetical protein
MQWDPVHDESKDNWNFVKNRLLIKEEQKTFIGGIQKHSLINQRISQSRQVNRKLEHFCQKYQQRPYFQS